MPGPGFYNPSLADRITKASSPSKKISNASSINTSISQTNLFKKRKSQSILNYSYHSMNGSNSVTKLDKSPVNESKISGSPLKATGKKKLSSAISFAKARPKNTKSPLYAPGQFEI